MNKRELLTVLDRLELHPSRRLGQNFLVDDNIVDLILRLAAPATDQLVVEIGPGTGSMTQRLLDLGLRLVAVEYDHRLANYLRDRYRDNARFLLVEADACDTNYDELTNGAPFHCIANLPYSCSSPLLARLTQSGNRPQRLHLMLQREMAERIAAPSGSRTYSAFSVGIQTLYQVSLERIVPASCFWPPPEVASAVVGCTLRHDAPEPPHYLAITRIARTAFAQRRKKAMRLLCAAGWPHSRLDDAFRAANIAPDSRAEHISVAQYRVLATALA